MTRSEFIQWLRGIEEGFPVTSWKVRGIRMWPLLRLSLSSSTFRTGTTRQGLEAGWLRRGANLAGGLAGWTHAVAIDRAANRRPTEPADAIFLTYSVGRRPLLQGKRYDVRTGPFVELLGRLGARSSVWEMSPFGDYNVPRHPPSFLVQPRLMALRAACQLLPLGEDGVELDRFDEFVAAVRAAGLKFAHGDVARLRRDAMFLRTLADTFAGWLRRSRPRLVFLAGAGLPEQALCLACRELGITSIELQHGVQGDFHPTYGSWFAVPREGWETRARIFWSWDEGSAAAINRWASCAPDRHIAVVGGDPWRQMWLDDASDTVRQADDAVDQRKRAIGGDRHILVTLSSQGDIVPAPVLDAVRASPPSWRYWFRLHHVNLSTRRAEAANVPGPLGADLSLMNFATEAPLYALLRRLDGHVTVGLSTVVAEAAALGVPSVACHPEAPDFFPEEIAAGMLAVGESSAEIVEALDRLMARGRGPASPHSSLASDTLRSLLDGVGR